LRPALYATLAIGALVMGAPAVLSQTKADSTSSSADSAVSKTAAIKSLRIVQEKDGPAVEILSTKPLAPSIQAISNPPRLVIDLPNARLETQQKRIDVDADQIDALRANQFQENPPVTRVVVDLQAPRVYTWDAAGNRLVVHLGKNPNQESNSPFQAPTVASLMSAAQPVIASVRAPGPLAIAGLTGGMGSAITAASETEVINLSSGGEVRVCPGTTLSISPSQNRHNMMLSMNTGALETHFALDASADSVMTPDFRIVLAGPGQFDFAISADSQGNTCLRALPGNTASAMVTELIGDRSYQVKPTDQLVFHSGQLDRVDMAVPLECGCPAPRDIPMRAMNNVPVQTEAENETQSKSLPPVNANPGAIADSTHEESAPTSGPAAVAPLGASANPNELHVQVTAPFVFRATGPPPAPVVAVRALPLDSRPLAAMAPADPLPPPAKDASKSDAPDKTSADPPPRGFFQKIGAFFAALFR
jgi:hypothetical protein